MKTYVRECFSALHPYKQYSTESVLYQHGGIILVPKQYVPREAHLRHNSHDEIAQ